jgi:hypothetical protein
MTSINESDRYKLHLLPVLRKCRQRLYHCHESRSPKSAKAISTASPIAVADYGSFSEAAQQLQISQSAVSYAIATLEDELGVVLFSRVVMVLISPRWRANH